MLYNVRQWCGHSTPMDENIQDFHLPSAGQRVNDRNLSHVSMLNPHDEGRIHAGQHHVVFNRKRWENSEEQRC
jgi:hypothetical protein